MRFLRILAAGILLSLSLVSAQAQQANNYWCTSATVPCPPSGWSPVSSANPLPVTATFTPSGTQNVNVAQILGAAPSLTNPLWVSPATGATFPISGTVTTTPSGTQNVNLSQILGAAPSLTNPLWITPATGASFAVTGTFFQATQPVSGTVTANLGSQYPTGATAVTASTTGTTAATAASLPATSSVTNYVCGFTITTGATSLNVGTATLSGTISGSLAYFQNISALATGGVNTLTQNFSPCIPASATNTAITITSAAAGAGGNTISDIWGYRF